ncbi:hypothetical protein [Nannocystis punicea]|uniref:Uncharacterized protein n=1 Tax=Nannocystis punicea TaxID=2995304 RepID=A0ABY7GY65_9BACT|nr:hypothetical protein [Nannocystis poenicansa]WAS91919.1 hypothetical protein O0S08_37530 [Nannocystis poenicansa]
MSKSPDSIVREVLARRASRWLETPLIRQHKLRLPPGGPMTESRLHLVLAHTWLHAALVECKSRRPRPRYVARFVELVRGHLSAADRLEHPRTTRVHRREEHVLERVHELLHVDEEGQLDVDGIDVALAILELGRRSEAATTTAGRSA